MFNWKELENKYPKVVSKIKKNLGLFYTKNDQNNLYEEIEDHRGTVRIVKFQDFYKLFYFFNEQGYFIGIDKDYDKRFYYKIYPKHEFISHRSGFEKYETAIKYAIEKALEIYELKL